MTQERAILAGGCFWGMEELIRKQPGILDSTVGYTGGSVPDPTYENHTGHAEAIEIVFDDEKTSYRKILEFFFAIHDPTTTNRQGNDVGTSYRSAIFYLSEAQKETAEALIAEIAATKKWPGAIVTEVTPAVQFYTAEGYHQDYLQLRPNGYTCHYIRPDWTL